MVVARVAVPFVRQGEQLFEGHVLGLRADEFRALYSLGYLLREFVPVWSPRAGRGYLHAVTPSGRMIGAPRGEDAPILQVDTPYDVAPPPSPRAPRAPRPPPHVSPFTPPVARRGCGCGGRRV